MSSVRRTRTLMVWHSTCTRRSTCLKARRSDLFFIGFREWYAQRMAREEC